MTNDWKEDCIQFYGKVLIGKFAHWCPEWDFLPIDETCEEFECCTCFVSSEAEVQVSDTTKLLNEPEAGTQGTGI